MTHTPIAPGVTAERLPTGEYLVRVDAFDFYLPNGGSAHYDLTSLGQLDAHLDAQRRPVMHLPGGLTIRKGEQLSRAKWKRVRETFEALGIQRATQEDGTR